MPVDEGEMARESKFLDIVKTLGSPPPPPLFFFLRSFSRFGTIVGFKRVNLNRNHHRSPPFPLTKLLFDFLSISESIGQSYYYL